MKLGPVTKIDKKNKTTSKDFDDEVMPANFDVIVALMLWVKVLVFAQKADFFAKIANISKIKKAIAPEGISSETKCVFTYVLTPRINPRKAHPD